MVPHQLEYHSPLAPGRPANIRLVRTATLVVYLITIFVNGLLLAWAASDMSWGAFGIMIAIGPITNAALVVGSLIAMPILQRFTHGAALISFVLSGIFAPIAAIVVDGACIMMMHLRGC